MSDSKIQNYIDKFYEENGHNKFREKNKLYYNKQDKVWQILEVRGIMEEILFENKDKNFCKEFVNENLKNNL